MTTPLRAILSGVVAGAVGTALMTAHQELRSRLAPDQPNSQHDDAEPADPWESAPAPAQVAKRGVQGVLGRTLPASAIPLVTQLMHWSYGTAWGAAYAVKRESIRACPIALGPLFGLCVWAASYVQLVPMGIYQPPWRYPLGSIAAEVAYHVTYGLGVAVTYESVTRR